ncbi:MAG: ribosomal-protein-alanine N-acetyltransferase [Betaproteobacteria bacterium RIFCSPLOWO2_12_FULL_64_23]|nr:MAG: ribosomal-protein-alanine N-acetyltransferase [Betaproteobacteria bacterium RIFCSPLOWO2_12_FULL_64_23]
MSAVLKPVIELCPMVEADLPEVMAIENAVYAFPWTPGNFRDSLAAGYGCWIYVRAGELIGYAVLMPVADEAHLLNLSIAANCQRQGYGSLLLQRLCEVARGHGTRLIVLEVRPSNAAGLRLYERHGFQRIGLRRDYYPAPAGREDALIFSLPL